MIGEEMENCVVVPTIDMAFRFKGEMLNLSELEKFNELMSKPQANENTAKEYLFSTGREILATCFNVNRFPMSFMLAQEI